MFYIVEADFNIPSVSNTATSVEIVKLIYPISVSTLIRGRNMDLKGADPQVTARGAQHSAVVKEKYYKKSGWEEFQEMQKKYHPAFREG